MTQEEFTEMINTAKDKDVKKIKEFSNINITEICRKMKVNRGNLLNGTASPHATRKVLAELIRELKNYISK